MIAELDGLVANFEEGRRELSPNIAEKHDGGVIIYSSQVERGDRTNVMNLMDYVSGSEITVVGDRESKENLERQVRRLAEEARIESEASMDVRERNLLARELREKIGMAGALLVGMVTYGIFREVFDNTLFELAMGVIGGVGGYQVGTGIGGLARKAIDTHQEIYYPLADRADDYAIVAEKISRP